MTTRPPSAFPLLEPAEGVPPVVADDASLERAITALAAGEGPLAVDAERASGYRYGQRAYLVQLRRERAGTWLIDPTAFPDLAPLGAAVADTEWILHAATQDLPCLAEVGLRPTRLFDTELGARLAGLTRVGLGTVAEHYLGVSLAKEHSAADWSTRPLPEPWLRYASLDVELLGQLRDAVEADLREQGKLDWARQEFDALVGFTGPAPRTDPWRRTTGIHKVRKRRALAVLRELWFERDRIARRRDLSPGRIVSDAVLVDLALDPPSSSADVSARTTLRPVARAPRPWLAAIDRAMRLPESQLPPPSLPGDGPPPPRLWSDRQPLAAARLAASRALLTEYATEHRVPLENLLTPDTLRRLLWSAPANPSRSWITRQLRTSGARDWQIGIAAPLIAAACRPEPETVRSP